MVRFQQSSFGLYVCAQVTHAGIHAARHREQGPRQRMCVRELSREVDIRKQEVLLSVVQEMKPLTRARAVLRELI